VRHLIVSLAAAALALTPQIVQANAGSKYPMTPIPKLASEAKVDCIPCKVKCKRCFVPGRRWKNVSECYADCDKYGNKLLNTTCGLSGAASRAGCS
jgi:hypothetical protein